MRKLITVVDDPCRLITEKLIDKAREGWIEGRFGMFNDKRIQKIIHVRFSMSLAVPIASKAVMSDLSTVVQTGTAFTARVPRL